MNASKDRQTDIILGTHLWSLLLDCNAVEAELGDQTAVGQQLLVLQDQVSGNTYLVPHTCWFTVDSNSQVVQFALDKSTTI